MREEKRLRVYVAIGSLVTLAFIWFSIILTAKELVGLEHRIEQLESIQNSDSGVSDERV